MFRDLLAATARSSLVRMITVGAAVGAATWLAARPATGPELAVAPVALGESAIAAPVVAVAADEPPPPERSKQLGLVFTAGGATYMEIGPLTDETVPKHGKATRSTDEYVESAVASVAPADVSLAMRGWLGKQVIVDGSCTASVVGFAVVARLVGEPAYAGIEDGTWSARSVMANGAKTLVARLDNCAGGTLARDAALSPVVVPEVVEDPALVATAKAKLLRSRDAVNAQAEWKTAEQPGLWYENESTATTAQVLRHPRTGVVWVSVHVAYSGGCGAPNANVWGLYRAEPDGTLTREPTRIGELTTIEKLVDVDGDGDLEVIGHPWLGVERTVQTLDGASLQDLALPLFYCPC